MKPQKTHTRFENICDAAAKLADWAVADALLLLVERPVDWRQLSELAKKRKIVDVLVFLATRGISKHQYPVRET